MHPLFMFWEILLILHTIMDDFKRITGSVRMANKNVGHGGTYSDAHGGSISASTVLGWLSWQLNGNKKKICRHVYWR